MQDDASCKKGALESALLFLSREESILAALLERWLPPSCLLELAHKAGYKKRGNHPPALQVAELLGNHAHLRKATVQAMLPRLPQPVELADTEDADNPTPAKPPPQQMLSALAFDLLAGNAAAWERLLQRIPAWLDELPNAKDQVASPPKAKPKKKVKKKVSKESALKQQLQEARKEIARLQEELGQAHRQQQELKQELAEAQAEKRKAEARATGWKKKHADSTQASAREEVLAAEAADAHQQQSIAEQKLQMLIWERDDLRACLHDRDRFDAIQEEEVPSFRNRPLLSKENELAKVLNQQPRRFRILVVGGGEPQFRHRDKLQEYAEVMGFESEWRMAEYVSWHKEMDKLATDMNTRFDALVILHWNRTTFTGKAREVCNQAGQKPCITCYYEGFTSLRETLQECLRQLLNKANHP